MLLPDLPLQVFSRGMADTGPLAVGEACPRQRLIAVNAAARAHGAHVGQAVASALAAAPVLRLRMRDPGLELDTLYEVAAWASAFSPHLSLDPPDTVLMEVSSSLRLFGGLKALRGKLVAGLAELGLEAALAHAATPLAARWLARHGAAPAGHAALAALLDPLPLAVPMEGGDLDASTGELLDGLGLRTLGDVRSLPRDGLARRQGSGLLALLARAYGEVPDPRPCFVPPSRFESRISLPASTTAIEPLLFAARRLFAGLSSWLCGRQAAVDHCALRLIHDDQPDTVLDIVVGTPSRDEARLAMLAREHLAALALPAAVEALALVADHYVPLLPRSTDLFGDPAAKGEDATLLLDRLQARLGCEAVRQLSLHADHRPERAWHALAPHGLRGRRAATGPSSTPNDVETPVRPLLLLAEPRLLGEDAALTLLAGPERIESGWWDEGEVRRDYYIARAPDRALWWVFHELDPPGAWYLHGYFS